MDPDERRFNAARLLNLSMPEIRERYKSYLQDGRTETEVELGLVLFLLDKLALEMESDRSEGVGILTLEKKHIQLVQPLLIQLSFLNNMSLPYEKQFYCGPDVFRAAQRHLEGKMLEDFVFTKVTSIAVNNELGLHTDTMASELFKTIHASATFDQLDACTEGPRERVLSYFEMVRMELSILMSGRWRRLPNVYDAQLSMITQPYQGLKKEINVLEEVPQWSTAMKRMGRLLIEVEKKHLLEKNKKVERKIMCVVDL